MPLTKPAAFDEDLYLIANKDVVDAVKAGSFESGWEHACLHGYREGRAELPASVVDLISKYQLSLDTSTASYHIPPSHLRKRVHGADDAESFIQIGRVVARNLQSAMYDYCLDHTSPHQVLDFGCGCGRVLVPLKGSFQNWEFSGTDIDEEAVRWARKNLSSLAEFSVNSHSPPLAYDAESFDIIYSISVFTHLPEEMQFHWLTELARIATRQCILLLSVHNIDLLGPTATLGPSGFEYRVGSGTEGLPNFYQTTCHQTQYIYNSWGRYLEILEVRAKAIAKHHDLMICRKLA